MVPSELFGSCLGWTPPMVAIPPCSQMHMWLLLPTIASLPRSLQWHRTLIRFAMIPEGTKRPASLPRSAAT